MQQFIIRPMTPSDLPNVLEIERACQVSPWTEGIFSDCMRVGYSCYTMVQEEAIVGFGVMSIEGEEGHLLTISITPLKQHQGLGRYFMNYLLSEARKTQAKVIFLEVRESNAAAIHLYQSLGFNEIGLRKKYYTTPTGHEDGIMFALELC